MEGVPELVGGVPVMPRGPWGSDPVVEPLRPAAAAAWLAEWPRSFLHWAAHHVEDDGSHGGPVDLVLRRSCDRVYGSGRDETYSSQHGRWWTTSFLHLGRNRQFESEGYPQVAALPIDWRSARQLVVDLHGPYADAGYPDPPSTMWHRYDTYHRPWK